MQIQNGSILNVNNNFYKVIGESKLYWLVSPFKILNKFNIDESIMLQSIEIKTYKRFSNTEFSERTKLLKSKTYDHEIVNIDDISKYYFYGCNKQFESQI